MLEAESLAALSKQRKQTTLRDELFRFHAIKTQADPGAGYFASILWYRASRHLIKALWLTFGLIFDAITGVLGVVGFVGCLYYLFATLNVVRPFAFEGDIDKRIEEIEEELSTLDRT